MARYLIAYYSRTGHTRKVATALAGTLGADFEEIRENRERAGIWNYLRSGYDALTGRLPELQPGTHDPSQYDLVLLGTPVWAGRPSTPMQAYVAANRGKFRQAAFFVTLGGSGAERTFNRLATATAMQPVATLAITETQMKSGAWTADMEMFAETVRGIASKA